MNLEDLITYYLHSVKCFIESENENSKVYWRMSLKYWGNAIQSYLLKGKADFFDDEKFCIKKEI